jgi:hypothetical protein
MSRAANKPANAVDAGFAAIFSDIVERHGGKLAFSPAALGIARMIAWTLAQDSPEPSAARTVLDLEKLLPPKAQPRELNYWLLSDRQVATLDRLMAIASGDPPPRFKRRLSHLDVYQQLSDLKRENSRLRSELARRRKREDGLTAAGSGEEVVPGPEHARSHLTPL